MTDVTYPLFSCFAFLGFVLALIPLPWHLQAWNSGTCYFISWTAVACLNQFINSVVWAGNALNPSPAWCEISIRIIMGSSVGIPASSLCIMRRLYLIASVQAVTVTPAEKRRAILIDTLICAVFPALFIALQYVVQGHRFNIFEDIGCYPALYNTLLTYFISLMWPIILGLISVVYCSLTLWEFNKRRLQFNQFLHSNGTLTFGRYIRLMALSMTEMLCTTPLSIFVIVLNATTTEIGPWRSWEDTHFDYSRMEQYPAVLWRRNRQLVISMELTRWVAPICAIIFFMFFGFAHEAKKNYLAAYLFLAKRLKFLPQPKLRTPKSLSNSQSSSIVPSNKSANGKSSKFVVGTPPLYSPSPLCDEKALYLTSSRGSNFLDLMSNTEASTKYDYPLTPLSCAASISTFRTSTPEYDLDHSVDTSHIALATFSPNISSPSQPHRYTM